MVDRHRPVLPLLLLAALLAFLLPIAVQGKQIASAGAGCHGHNCPTPTPSPTSSRAPLTITSGPVAGTITDTSAYIDWWLSDYATGQVEYGLTTSYGSFSQAETSFNYNHHHQPLTSLAAGTLYHYRVSSTDQYGQKVTSADTTFTTTGGSPSPTPTPMPVPTPTPTPQPTPTPTPVPTPTPTPVPTPTPPPGTGYGSAWADTLNNLQIGGTSCGCANQRVAYPFIAKASGQLTSVGFYFVDGAGYAGGNGGFIEVSIQSDSAGTPSGTKLATTSVHPGNPVNIGYLPTLTFASPATVTAGTHYHVVFTNIDASPTVNYMSVNGVFTFSAQNPRQPHDSDQYSTLRSDSGTAGWATYGTNKQTAIVDINIGGQHQGQGYMQIWVGSQRSIGGTAQVREHFTPTASVSATTLSLRVSRGSGTGALTITLNGVTATIPSSSIAIDSTPNGDDGGDTTVSVPISVSLNAGTTYDLVLSAPSGTTYYAYGIERGNGYNFSTATYFHDGYGQYTTNGSTWTGLNGGTNSDLQFWLQ